MPSGTCSCCSPAADVMRHRIGRVRCWIGAKAMEAWRKQTKARTTEYRSRRAMMMILDEEWIFKRSGCGSLSLLLMQCLRSTAGARTSNDDAVVDSNNSTSSCLFFLLEADALTPPGPRGAEDEQAKNNSFEHSNYEDGYLHRHSCGVYDIY